MTRIEKPWGYELLWAKTDAYAGKVLHVNAGHRLSWQYHERKDETIHVWAGRVRFVFDDGSGVQERELSAGEGFHIAPGVRHRMIALTDCDILEASTAELDDVVRLEDAYGRAK